MTNFSLKKKKNASLRTVSVMYPSVAISDGANRVYPHNACVQSWYIYKMSLSWFHKSLHVLFLLYSCHRGFRYWMCQAGRSSSEVCCYRTGICRRASLCTSIGALCRSIGLSRFARRSVTLGAKWRRQRKRDRDSGGLILIMYRFQIFFQIYVVHSQINGIIPVSQKVQI